MVAKELKIFFLLVTSFTSEVVAGFWLVSYLRSRLEKELQCIHDLSYVDNDLNIYMHLQS